MRSKLPYTFKRFFKHPLFLSYYLPSFIFAVAWGVRTPVLPLFASQLSEGYGLVGLVVAGAGLGTLITYLPSANIIRNINKRHAMILGITIDALSTMALFWVGSLWVAVLLRILSGIGHAVFSIARHTLATNTVRATLRGRAMALYGGVIRIGLFIGPAMGGMLAEHFNLRVPFIIFPLLCLFSIIVILLSGDGVDVVSDQQAVNLSDQMNLKEVMKGRLKGFILAGSGVLLAQITRSGVNMIMPLWASDILLLSPLQVGWAVSLVSGVSMTLFYPAGLIMDRIGRKFAIVPSFLIMGAGLALLPLTKGFGGLLLAAGIIGLGNGLGSGAVLVLGSDLSPEEGRSAFLGAWLWLADIGSSGGPMILGWVAEIFTLSAAALVTAGAGLLTGSVFLFFVPETLKKKLTDLSK